MFTNATDFLKYVLGYSALPDISQYSQKQIGTLTGILEKLSNGSNLVTMTGSWEDIDGQNRNAICCLHSLGVLDDTEFNLFNTLKSMDNMPGTTVTAATLQNLNNNYGLNLPSTITTEDELFDAVYEMYREDIIDGINSKITDIQENGPVTPIAPPATGGTLPTGDELYSEIESKMDSLNSFSQAKMIELQSETNKRDQAYDIITNVLKSLNNTQVGIANNI